MAYYEKALEGGSGKVSTPEQAKWIMVAAELGVADAQYSIGITRGDRAEKIRWLRLAAAQGHEPAARELKRWSGD
jgi:TPR repeat protein